MRAVVHRAPCRRLRPVSSPVTASATERAVAPGTGVQVFEQRPRQRSSLVP